MRLSRHYAQDRVRAGVWSAEEAQHRAAKGHFLYLIRDDSIPATVGNLWLAVLSFCVGPSECTIS